MSERILDTQSAFHASELVTALQVGLSQIPEMELPGGMYGFGAVIETDNVRISLADGFDFEFEVPFDDDFIPNESTVKIYNLKSETINNLKKGNSLTITAGYGTDAGIILSGIISAVKTKREGVDRITTIYVLDNIENSTVEFTFAENTKASTILKYCLEQTGLPIEVFNVQRDHTFTQETAVKGDVYKNIKQYSDICGVSTYVSKQRIYCRPIWDGDNIHFKISPQTGMIDSPEPFEEMNTSEEYVDTVTGYNINMLFQHRMNTAAIVDVDGKDYKGTFRVCSGTHSFDGLSAVTNIKCIENITTVIIRTETGSEAYTDDSYGGNAAIERAVGWAVEVANDDSHGYDQGNRWGPDYDCSSFVISAWQQAGVKVKDSGASYTGDMYDAFVKCGFRDVTASVDISSGRDMKKGDVLLNTQHHTALVIADGGKLANASINENNETTGGQAGDQTGREIYVRDYYNYPWNCVLRYPSSAGISASDANITRNIMFQSKGSNSMEYLVLHTSCAPGVSAQRIAEIVGDQGLSIHGVISNTGVLQTAEWESKCWHCGSGNSRSIGFEQCESGKIKWNSNATVPSWSDSDNDVIKEYHDAMYNQAVAVFAFLSNKYNIPSSKVVSHKEIAEIFGGSDHADPEELWIHFVKRWGDNKYTMDAFREAVEKAKSSSGGSSTGGDNSGWTTGYVATTYGYGGDDNGVCGWNGLRYHDIDGCHVAIPKYCIKRSSSYRSKYHKADFPQFTGDYGQILEVRNPDNGKSVLAVIADCGSFGPHGKYNPNAALDLPPNTFNALGLGHGTYPIEFRDTGKSLKSWKGTQTEIDNA